MWGSLGSSAFYAVGDSKMSYLKRGFMAVAALAAAITTGSNGLEASTQVQRMEIVLRHPPWCFQKNDGSKNDKSHESGLDKKGVPAKRCRVVAGMARVRPI
jgi:hypothetical protein